ncbi:hypothetical protein Pfo_011311 [Paulownia fortunei]|nr:hypothetical protein Pfo_011311 [Paulownia fortunei]
MDSANESFTISSKDTLLDKNQQPSPNKNLKAIFFSLLILLSLIAGSIILSSLSKKRQPRQLDAYFSGSTRYYCHLTMYPELCYDSMSSIISSTALKSNPGPIFSTSLQVAINELNNITISITKSLSSTTKNSLVGPRLSKCRTWAHDSLSRLNESLSMLGVDSDVESLTYVEMDNMKAWTFAATSNAFKCFSALEEIIDGMVDGDQERMGVEGVKLGVEKARKYMVNSIGLLDGRESILFDFYNPFFENDGYYEYSYFNFDYRFMVCLYSALYLFLALLYFLFWNSS